MPPPQQSSPQGDHSLAALWIAALFLLLIWAVGYFFHDQMVRLILIIKSGELTFLGLFTEQYQAVQKSILTTSLHKITWADVYSIMQQVGQGIRYIMAPILLLLAGLLFIVHPSVRFKKIHNMKSLLAQEKFNWPQIVPVTKTDLVKAPLEKGRWSMALTPMQFAKHYRLLYEEHEEKQVKIGSQREKVNVGLMRAPAYQIFAIQVGPTYHDLTKLAPHTKALFAIFAARANRDPQNAKLLLDQLAKSSVDGNLDFSHVETIFNKYKNGKDIKKLIAQHAFVLTLMASMLELGRQDGVIASADFLWVKLIDRPLWYMLNAVGRQTPSTEVGGAFAHWVAEKKLGRRISVPMVEEAVKALEGALQDVLYIPDEAS